jgi:integrase
VALKTQTFRVAHSLDRMQLVSPKTVSSARPIPFGTVLTDTLVTHHRVSVFTGPDDFVFCKEDGSSLNPDVLRKDVLYPVLDRLNIPRIKGALSFHSFRHSGASLINAKTGNLKLAQKFLGHSNVRTPDLGFSPATEIFWKSD